MSTRAMRFLRNANTRDAISEKCANRKSKMRFGRKYLRAISRSVQLRDVQISEANQLIAWTGRQNGVHISGVCNYPVCN